MGDKNIKFIISIHAEQRLRQRAGIKDLEAANKYVSRAIRKGKEIVCNIKNELHIAFSSYHFVFNMSIPESPLLVTVWAK